VGGNLGRDGDLGRFAGESQFPSGEPIDVTWRIDARRAPVLVVVDDGAQ